MLPPSPVSRDQLHKRIDSLQQQNRVLKVELETYKLRVKALQEENRALRQASVHIQVITFMTSLYSVFISADKNNCNFVPKDVSLGINFCF